MSSTRDIALHGSLSANVVGFCRLLRAGGAKSGPGEVRDALRALRSIDVSDGEDFRMCLRTTLAKDLEEQRLFDELFAHYWQVWERAHELNERRSEGAQSTAAVPGPVEIRTWLERGGLVDEEREAASYSAVETLSRRNFKDFRGDELDELSRLVRALARSLSRRLSRRQRAARRGRIDLRKSLRGAARHGFELLELRYRHRRRRKLKLVLLCDVSKSMDLYSRFLVQFIYAFQSAYKHIETFVFSTSLQRITPQLKSGDLQVALDEVSAHVPQWSGGTKIGLALRDMVREHGEQIDRNTAFVIISDGWDTGDIDVLEEHVRALQRRARCLIWLNPLLGSADYKPVTRGMQAVLPYVDVFAPVHNLESLQQLAHHLERSVATSAALPVRRGAAAETAVRSIDWRGRFGL